LIFLHDDTIENYLLVVVAIINFVAAWMLWRVHKSVKEIAVSTNGMKDELVKATKENAYAAGLKDGRKGPPPAN
jgi:ABC-type nickel/cobalt efflux system permease component RcnA